MQRLLKLIVRTADALTIAVMVAVFAVMVVGVVFRYGLNASLIWSDDFLIWGLVWIVMLGSVGVLASWRHVYVPVAVLALPLRARIPVLILSKLLTIAFLVFVVVVGFSVFNGTFHRTSLGLGLSTRWMKLALPVGAGLMCVVGVIQVWTDVRAWLRNDVEHFSNYGDADLDL